MSNRIKQVNELIRQELSQIILKEMDFSNDVLITITRVECSLNFMQANIYTSVIFISHTIDENLIENDFEHRKNFDVLNILNNRVHSVQKLLNKRLNMRPVPKIKFMKDKQVEKAEKIEKILEGVKIENKPEFDSID